MDKYQISQLNDGRWCCMDMDHGITLTWVPLQFNDTQEASLADQSPDNLNPTHLAALMSEMGDWLNTYHADLLYEMSPNAAARWSRHYIAERLRTLREDQGVAARTLSLEAGLDAGYVSRIEREVSSATIDNLAKILNVLGARITIG